MSIFLHFILYLSLYCFYFLFLFFFSSRRRHTRCALVTGVQTCALPICIDVDAHPQDVAAEVRRLAGEVWTKLALPGAFPADKVILEPGYAGAAYGLPTTAMKDAVQRTAQPEGLLLDPGYTGKALAGLMGLLQAGPFKAAATVVLPPTRRPP